MIDLNEHLRQWLDEGIINADQAELMRRSVSGAVPDEPERRIPLVAEIFGYLGAALATWAVIFLVAEYWGTLAYWAQATLFAVLSFSLLAGGSVLLDEPEPALRRLSGVLWAGSVVALSGAMWVLFDPIGGLSVEATWTMIGLGAALAAGAMHWRQPSVVQHITLYAAAMTGVIWLMNLATAIEVFAYGFLVWGIGLAWGLAARSGLLVPGRVGMVIGAISMFYGAQLVGFDGDFEALGIWLGLVTATLFAVGGVVLREKATIIVGGIGIFWFVPQAMFHFFGETFGGMMGLFLSGLTIIGLAIWFSRNREDA